MLPPGQLIEACRAIPCLLHELGESAVSKPDHLCMVRLFFWSRDGGAGHREERDWQ